MTESSKSYTIRQYPPNPLLDNGTYSDNDLTYTSSISGGTDISGTQYGGGSYIVKYSSYKENNTNLIARYKFDNNATNMLLDSTGNGNNLTNYGTTFDNTNYKVGVGSVYLNGNSQYISIPSTISPYTIWNNNGITFSLWSKLSTSSGLSASLLSFGDITNTNADKVNIIEPNITSGGTISAVPISTDYKYLAFTYQASLIEQKTGVGGWRLVRYLPPTSNAWHPTNDNLVGTETYGTAYNNTNAWSIPFGTFDEFCFGTLNLQKWLYCKKTSVYGNYSNVARDIIKSSYSSTPYQANWYSRTTVYNSDPIIVIQNDIDIVYRETGDSVVAGPLVSIDGGMAVWVRDSTATQVLQTSYTVNFPENAECDILIVGGGGGGSAGHGGGGGAGQLVLIYNAILNGTYNVNVGKGGTGGRSTELTGGYAATKGGNSTFSTVTAEAGGTNTSVSTDKNGGSGAGGDYWTSDGGTAGFGIKDNNVDTFSGGIVYTRGNDGAPVNGTAGGGGGGAGMAGNLSVGGDGLSGINEINFDFRTKFGTSVGDYISNENKVYFAGGGGGGANTNTSSKGGGGAGSSITANVFHALQNTGGGGGGGAGGSGGGGNGGSGIVLVRYKLTKIITSNIIEPNITSGGTITPVTFGTDYKYLTFTNKGENQTVYTVNFPENAECDILVVGGGGGGGVRDSGGGGGGGVVLRRNYTVSSNTTVTISVGKGGNYIIPGQTSNSGFDSSIVIGSTTLTAIGGGGGGGNTGSLYGGRSGGSGGGGGYGTSAGTATQPTSASGGYGNNGSNSPGGYVGGGGGGAGSAGKTDGNENIGRTGGDGIDMSAIFGTMVGHNGWFAGGGGSGGYSGGSYGNGGVDRFGGASKGETATATDAMPNTGGGGGSVQNGWSVGDRSGGGGSGVVIIRYKLTKILPTNININNLVAYYKFNDSSSLGLDSNPSSTKYNLTPTIVGGTGGYNSTIAIEGASFQATNDGDRLEGDFPLKSLYDSSTTGISVSCWFYKKSASYDNIYNTHLFHFHNPSDSSQWINMSVSHYNNVYKANFSFSYISGETYCNGWGPIQTLDTWYHVVLILTKSGNIKVYLNGTNLNLVSGTTDGTIRWYNSSVYPLPQCPNTTKLKIFTTVGSGAFNGNIDEFYVFNKELTQAEVTSLYNKTITSNTLNIIEPSITSGGTITPVPIGTDYKYLEFSSIPDLIHNFTDFNTEATWRAKADSIQGFTYSFAAYFADGYAGMWSVQDNVGYIEYQLPSSYNNLTVNFGNLYYQSEVRLLINGVVKKSATAGQGNLTHTQSYNAGDILRVEELYAIMNADLIITLTKTTPTQYTLNFPTEGTECSALIVGNPNYTYLQNLSLYGTYNIIVGNASSITKSDNSITYNNSVTAQTVPFTNTITDSTVTYNLVPKVILRYKLTKTITSNSLNIIEPTTKGIKQFPETASTNADSWTDNGFNVVCKTSDAILSPQNTCYLFNNLIASPDHYHSAQLFSGSSPFNYSGSTSFKGTNGLVIYIDLGRSIVLRSMRIAPRDNAAFPTLNFLGAMPNTFKIYASNDSACWTSNTHNSWIEIHSQTTSLTYNYNQFTDFGNFSTNNTAYRYFAMVVYNLTGSYTYLTFSEWDIFGTYDISPVPISYDYKYLSFTHSGETENQTSYTVNFPENTECDILVVGGGGGGGQQNAGGGGAGGLVLIQNFQANGTYTINVGKGGAGGNGPINYGGNGSVGNNSTFIKSDNSVIITANGGGGGGGGGAWMPIIATNGGSGGGGGWASANGTQTQKSQSQTGIISPAILNQFGEDGGHGGGDGSSFPGGGGGGAGGVGATSGSYTTGQNGGLGIDRVGTFVFSDKFSSSIGDSGWFAGGGGSGGDGNSDGYGNGGNGLFGGGGGNGDGIGRGINGINGTGGGGGSIRDPSSTLGGNGGSGIVLIRYKFTKTSTTNSQNESSNWIAINKNSTNNDIKFEIQNSAGTGSSYTLSGYSYNNGLVSGTATDSASTTYVNLLNLGITLGSTLLNWSFYTSVTGRSITPLILEDTGSSNYVIRGIGTSRTVTTAGLNSYSFGLVEGTNVFSTSNYKFGWKDGTTTSTNQGVISFNSNNAVAQTTYALGGNSSTNISLNSTYNFGNQLLGNRTYSFKLDFNSTTSIIDNIWHHIVWSISSTGVWSIYIDNQYINSNITRTPFNVTYTRQYIGKSLFSSNGWLIGNIDDLRIYNKVLTTNEIASIYNNSSNNYPLIIFKNDPAYWSKIDASSSQPNWAGNYELIAPYSYIDNSYLVNNFRGDYVTIKLPYKIYLTKYVLCSTINKLKKAPQHFSIYGSVDGVNWNKIVEKHLTQTSYINTQIPNSTNSTGYYTDDETKSTVAYDYYGIVVNKLIGPLDTSDNNLSFSLWNIYGTNDLRGKSYFEFGVVTDTSKTIGSSLKDGLIRTNNSNIFIKSGNVSTPALTLGANNKVAIGKNIANEALDISGSIIVNEYRIKNQNYPVIDASSNITTSGNIDISGNLTLNNNKFVVNSSSGKLSVVGSLDISKNININNGKTIIDSSGNIKSQGNLDLSSNININNYVLVDTSGSVIMNNTLDLSNNATLRSSLDIKGNIKSSAFTTNSSINKVSIRNTSVDPSYNFHVTGSTRLEGNLDIDGNIIIVDTVQQTSEQFIINNDGNTVALTVKQIGAQPIIDLRDDNKSVFYLADNGLLGLGTTTPSCTVDVSGSCYVQQALDVSGNLNISGNTYLSENIVFNDILDVSRNLNINNKFFVDPSGNIDICGNMLIYGYLISNGNNANSGGFQQDGNAIINGELRVLYSIDISQNLRVLDTFIVDTSGNIKSKGKFDLSSNLRNGSNYSINTEGNVYSAGNIDISKNFNINNGVFSADVSGNIIVNGFIDISKNLYVNGNKFTIDQNGNITAMGNFDVSQNLTINTNKFIVDASGNIKSAGNLDITNNFIVNNGTFKIDNNGNISSQSNFDISGNMSINGSKFTASNTGNIKSAGTLDISKNFSINNDKFAVDSSGNTIAKGNVDISTNLSIGNNKFNVDASGNIKSSGTLDISKNLKIGNTLLTVNHQNKRVGINTTTPEYSLDVSGHIVTNKAIMGSSYTLDSSSNALNATTTTNSQVNIIEPQSLNVESIYPPYRYFTYNNANGIYTVQNGSMEAGDSTNFSYTYSYNDPANTQGNNEQTSSTFKNTYGMGLYKFSVGGTQHYGGTSSGLFIYALSSDYSISTSGNRPAVNYDVNPALPNGSGWYVGAGWTNSTTYNSSYYYNTTFQGAWIKIEMPNGIILSSFKILGGVQKYRSPKAFKIYGSNTNTTTASDWTLLHTETNYTYNAGGDFGVKQTVNNNLMFKNYLLVVSEQHTYDGSLLVFQGWYIYGKEEIKPVTINNDYKYFTFTNNTPVIEQKTGVGGWRLVRFLPPTSTNWDNVNDNLVGITTYGTAYDYTNKWSIPFGTFDEFCFGTLNLQYWLYTTKNSAIGANYSGTTRSILKSSFSSTPYTAIWYNRTGQDADVDPWISIQNHPTQMVYGETGLYSNSYLDLISLDGGMAVWVRNSADAQSLSTPYTYTVNFPTEGTECSALIIGNPNYTYLQNLPLSGTYNIAVGNTSSITKSDNSITYNNSVTTQTVPFTNTITDSTVTYNLVPRVILRYKLTKTITSNSQVNIIEPQSDWKITTFTHSGGTESQTLYNVDFPAGTECDILIVGGGGSGGIKAAGGGGAGGLIFRQNQTLNGSYTIIVGNGGNAINVNNTGGLNGYNSSFGDIIALGGGGGGAYENDGKQAGSGGSGGGSFVPANVGYDIDANSYGNNGGIGKFNYWGVPETSMYWAAGGGGGAGSKGEDAGGGTGNANRSLSYAGGGGNGLAELNGIDFKTHFNLPTNNSIGQYISAENKVYFAGGGGGGNDVGDATAQAKIPLGGKGGGGIGINNIITNNLINALANSGGGGGSWGSGGGAANQISGRGGSGIVIIKYRIKPVTINNDYKYFTFTNNTPVIEQKTGVGGWRLVRFLPPTATAWHPTNDNLAGTLTYGTAYNNTNAWSIPFGTFDEFVFGTLNLQYWMYITKTEAIGVNYSGGSRNIIKSSFSSTPYTAIQYNRAGMTEDPWMSIKDHLSGNPADQIVYGENSYAGPQTALVSVDGGMGVWVRNSADAQSLSTSYTYSINFPTEGTECSALIIGKPNYTYLQNLPLSGTYNIVVGNTSSITKSDNSITYNNSVTTQTVPFTNTITDSTVTYNLVPKVILRYKLTKTITSNFQNIIEPTVSILDRITKNTGMTGWVQIKHLPGGAEIANNTGDNGRTWFSGNTFNGSTVNSYTIGNPSNNAAEWSIPFDSANVEYYLFYENTNDFNSEWYDRWAVIRKSDMVEVNYPNWKPLYKALNYPNGKAEGLQYNRTSGQDQDPNFFGTVPHLKKDGTSNLNGPFIKIHSMYIENSAIGWYGAPPAEVNVYVKYTTDTYSQILVQKAEQVTGVKGWIHVKHLPAGSTTWYRGNDNLQGNFEYNQSTKLENQEWAIKWNDAEMNQVLFTKGSDLSQWLHVNSSDLDRLDWQSPSQAINNSHDSNKQYVYYRSEGQWTSSPYIFDRNCNWGNLISANYMLYQEQGDVGYGGVGKSWPNLNTDFNPQNFNYDVFVRSSTSMPNITPVSIDTDYKYLSFINNGSNQTSYTVNFPENTVCDILVVGGGGAGGNDRGGGGGGGGVVYTVNQTLIAGTYTITVGKGGIGNTSGTTGGSGTRGTNGYDTSISGNNFTTITGIGGGAGGSCAPNNGIREGISGGSGGGGSQFNGAGSGGSGIVGQGKSGGTGYEGGAAGGGGGFVNAGTNANSTDAGNGGIGLSNSITGTTVIYGSGGGGGGSDGSRSGSGYTQAFGIGGSSGAGNGANVNTNGGNGTSSTGCGGGGAGLSNGTVTKGGNGGSGIVIIRYKLTKTITSNSQNIIEPVIISETIERIYPPIRNATSNTTTITGQTYGNGVYIVSASSNHPGEEPFKIINTDNTGWTQSWTSYNGTPAGTYTGTFSLGGYSGESVKIQLPYKIKLTRYIIEASSIGGVNRAPSIYKIFGSNDDSNWVEIYHKSVALISSNYVSNKFEETISNTNYYKYYALVVNKNIGLDTWLSIGEWQIYGREKITPESIDTDYKYLAFTYQASPSVVLREYPPSAMTINSTTLLVGGTDAAGNTYGAGTYIINYPYGWSDIDLYTLFNKSIGYNWIGSLGSSFNGNYIGAFCSDTRASLGTYFGSCTGTLNDRVWTYLSSSATGISIDLTQDTNSNKYYGSTFTYTLPSPIYLQNLQLYNRSAYSTFAAQAPKSFRVYGMNIGDNGWTQIANYSNLNAWTSYTSVTTASNIIWNGATGAENLTFKINANASYSMYGFVVNALLGSNENFTLAEIKLFGTDYYVPPSGQASHTVNFPENTVCDILVVGGGGAGGASVGGGGGAGGVVYQKNITLNGIYTIVVGKGGDNTSSTTSTANEDSVHNGLSSQIMYQNNILSVNGVSFEGKGGGGGGSRIGEPPGNLDGGFDGGSGGGNSVSGNGIPANPGSSTQENTLLLNGTNVKGGYNSIKTTENWMAGGGAGSGNSNSGMNGGAGIELDITGSLRWYAAGGGAGRISTSAGGIGGSGIGGSGKSNTTASNSLIVPTQVNGAINTGSGGGGGGYYYGYITNGPDGDGGGAGGSGIVIIRYKYTKTINTGYATITYSNDATFGYRNTDTTFIPSIVQLNTGQTFINSLSQYINFNFGNDNKCKMDASGNLTLNGDIFIYSDGRIKENVTTITSALDKVNEMSGITYNMINKQKRQVGVVAQEVEKVLPEVIKEEGGLKTVAYPNMVGLLIEALKELNDRVDQSM